MTTLYTSALALGLVLASASLASAQNLTLPFNVGMPRDEQVVTTPRAYEAVPQQTGRSVYYGTRTPAQIDRYRGYEQGGE